MPDYLIFSRLLCIFISPHHHRYFPCHFRSILNRRYPPENYHVSNIYIYIIKILTKWWFCPQIASSWRVSLFFSGDILMPRKIISIFFSGQKGEIRWCLMTQSPIKNAANCIFHRKMSTELVFLCPFVRHIWKFNRSFYIRNIWRK